MRFHFPVVTGELAVCQLVTGLGNETSPLPRCVAVRCFSRKHVHSGFVKQRGRGFDTGIKTTYRVMKSPRKYLV